jgi:hypothetical protein
VTYGFFLTVDLGPKRIQSDETDIQEIILPDPIGKIRYRGEPPDKSFSDSTRITFRGSAYHDRAAALLAGRTLKEIVQLASVDAKVPIDVGAERIRTQPGQVMIDTFADQAIQLLPDVHGLLVFEETGDRPAPLTMSATAIVSTPLKYFMNALVIRAHITKSVSAKQSLACQVYSLSNFEVSQRSRLLSLVTVLDLLSTKISREGISLSVATELLDIAKIRLKEARKGGHGQQEVRQLESLVSIVGALKYVSISASIKMLAKDIAQEVLLSQLTSVEIIDQAYKARNELIHGGETSVDLGQLIDPLGRLVAELSAGMAISVKECAEILDRSESTVIRYIRSSRLKATKKGGRWFVSPEGLKLFM